LFYKLGRKFFEIFINIIQMTRVFLVFWCFFIILYWILQIAQVKFIENFAMFFEPIKEVVHVFYNRDVIIDQVSVDFSFLYATFFLLLVAWGLKFFAEFIENTQKKYDEIHDFFKEKNEQVLNAQLDLENKLSEKKKKSFLILASFQAKNLKKDSFFDRNVDVGVEDKEKIALNLFCSNFAQSINCQQKKTGKNVLMYFSDFEDINKVIANFEKVFEKLKTEFKEQNWSIDFTAGIEAYLEQSEINEKVNLLEKLIRLNLKNEILCLSGFKQRYLVINKPEYEFSCKGIYDINGHQEVFCLINKNKIRRI